MCDFASPEPSALGQMAGQLVRPNAAPGAGARRQLSAVEPQDMRWLERLGAAARRHFGEVLEVRELPAGYPLLRAGQPPREWVGVLRGFVPVTGGPASRHSTPEAIPEGAWFADNALIGGSLLDCDATTVMPTRVACVAAADFRALLDAHCDFSDFILELQAQRYAFLRQQSAWPCEMSTDAKVACALASMFKPGVFFGGRHYLRSVQSVLGDFLSLSRQRTNAALRLLQGKGLVKVLYGGIEVLDPDSMIESALNGRI
ncbi:MAG: Crp/Fnr family transcriptional regulator [Pseudomonadota bacterium]